MAAKQTLDRELAGVATKSVRELSSSMRRFCEWHRVEDPIQAIAKATAELLKSYSSEYAMVSPVSVSNLCQLVGVRIWGRRPRAPETPYYSAGSCHSRRTDPRGELRFEDGQPIIGIPNHLDYPQARLTVAHELGHFLIHKRGEVFDTVTIRLGPNEDEEPVAEYAARLLLMPLKLPLQLPGVRNIAENCVVLAGERQVTVHSSTLRVADPDRGVYDICGAILWRMNPNVEGIESTAKRLTPQWFAGFSGAFIPVGTCHARSGSLVAQVADAVQGCEGNVGTSVEDVAIGSVEGAYKIDAFAWGSVANGTRLVLSLFSGVPDADERS